MGIRDEARDGLRRAPRVERGEALDEPFGPPGATVRHLLAHASGLGPEGGADQRARADPDLLERRLRPSCAARDRSGQPIATVLENDVLGPLGMTATRLIGRASAGLRGSLDDLARFGRELLRPSLISPGHAAATTVPFPGLAAPRASVASTRWIGARLRAARRQGPALDGHRNSPDSSVTSGERHVPVGGSRGDLALACLTERPFGPWALEAWPALSDAVLERSLGQRANRA